MSETILNTENIDIDADILINGEKTFFKDKLWAEENIQITASEYINCLSRPRAVALDGYDSVKKTLKGKVFSNLSTDILLGICNKNTPENRFANLVSQGIVVDNGLIGGELNQSVYADSAGYLTLSNTICKIGHLIGTATPTVLINIGIESSNVDLNLALAELPLPFINGPSLAEALTKIQANFKTQYYISSATLPAAGNIAVNSTGNLVLISGANIYWSSDKGDSWNPVTYSPSRNWDSIKVVNDKFFILKGPPHNNDDPALGYSDDGINWNFSYGGTLLKNVNSVAFNGSKFLATREGLYTLIESNNGLDYVAKSPLQDTQSLKQIIRGHNNRFVTIGSDPNGACVAWAEDGPGTDWNLVIVPQNNNWTSIAKNPYANEYVAVSKDGTNRVMTSTDAINWTLQTAAEQNSWEYVIYFVPASLWVAVASDGVNRVMTSPDGINWTPRTAPEQNSWRSVCRFGSQLIAVASDGVNRIMTSPDGINWTARAAPEQNSWRSVAATPSAVMAVAEDGINRSMYSTDGISWTSIPMPQQNPMTSVAVDYYNTFYAISSSGTNQAQWFDGTNWVLAGSIEAGNWQSLVFSVSNPNVFTFVGLNTAPAVIGNSDAGALSIVSNSWNSIAYGNGRFVALSEPTANKIKVSTDDGNSWVTISAPQANSWRSITFGNGVFVAVSEFGANRVMTSPDGINWTLRNASQIGAWHSIAFGGGVFVVIEGSGTDKAMTSPDGINWSNKILPAEVDASASSRLNYLSNIGKFVITESSSLITSSDGNTWTLEPAPIAQGFEPTEFNFFWYNPITDLIMAHGGLGFVAEDLSFTKKFSEHPEILDVEYGNGAYFLITNNSGILKKTTNLIDFETIDISALDFPYFSLRIAYGSNAFVIYSYSGTLFCSLDGETWNPVSTPENYLINEFQKLIYINGLFLVFATDLSPTANKNFLLSTDGINWTTSELDVRNNDNAVKEVFFDHNYYILNKNDKLYFASATDWAEAYEPQNISVSTMAYNNGTVYVTDNTMLYRLNFNGF